MFCQNLSPDATILRMFYASKLLFVFSLSMEFHFPPLRREQGGGVAMMTNDVPLLNSGSISTPR